jgi:hypothetical protein
MKLIEILNAAQLPKFLYHATYKPYLKSIKQNGLGAGKLKKNYDDSKTGVTYFATDFDEAVSYAETSDEVDDDYLDEIIVLRVKTADLNLSNLNKDANVIDGETTYEYYGIVPFNKLKVFKDES